MKNEQLKEEIEIDSFAMLLRLIGNLAWTQAERKHLCRQPSRQSRSVNTLSDMSQQHGHAERETVLHHVFLSHGAASLSTDHITYWKGRTEVKFIFGT
jgi:hypothetical protein